MSLESEVAILTLNTSNLLSAVNVIKANLDAAVNVAISKADEAVVSANQSANSAAEAYTVSRAYVNLVLMGF